MTPAMALALIPRPMTEREAYARLGWPEEGGLAAGKTGSAALSLPMCDIGGGENWFIVQCEPCGMTGVARKGTEAGCGICRQPFTRIIGK
jgi:hypothetical protein